jgi:hypothetical protein
VEILLQAPADSIAGEAFACYDLYISDHEVAAIARELTGSRSEIRGAPSSPKHQIVTAKLQALGMRFGGRPLLEQTIRQIAEAARTT